MKIKIYPKIYTLVLLTTALFYSSILLTGQSCIGEQGTLEWYIFENIDNPDFTEFKAEPIYPLNPTFIEVVNALASPERYNDDYGSILRGFIKAPETGAYAFNVTSDDESQFYLSTDTLPDNMTLTCEVINYTGTEEHTKYPEQTSMAVNLIQDEYYFFEAIHVEGGGGDFVWMHWKTPSDTTAWNIIGPDYIYKYNCAPICPDPETPCDDSDASTENDMEDGHCHCMGTPIAKPSYVGERGGLMVLYYDTIPGSNIPANLGEYPDYPLSPDRAEVINSMRGPSVSQDYEEFLSRMRGYLRVPVTGDYVFNVTGDNKVSFRISPNELTADSNEVAYNDGYSWHYDFYNTPEQTSDSIHLTAGEFYSIEFLHKEGNGGEHFYLFWKTPYAQDTAFQIVDGIFLYQYADEMACIPAGTPCDDGDANTFNDEYDGNCNCAGVPCADPSCSNALNYTPYEPCDEETDRHSANPNSSWLSCEPTQSPNSERGISHWIQYDFGDIYSLDQAQIWNYNALGASGDGFQTVIIDYSLDGVNWSELGTFTWDQATGNGNYSGFNMPDFSGISAQYVLFTAVDNYSGSGCVGLSEIIFDATSCPNVGEPCDDGNPLTINDQYNEACYCTGEFTNDNTCDSIDAIINHIPIATNKYGAEMTITSSGMVKSGSNVLFVAGEYIDLLADFEVELGAGFTALIDPCTPESFKRLKNNFGRSPKEGFNPKKRYRKKNAWLKLKNSNANTYNIEYNIPKDKNIWMVIYENTGTLVGWVVHDQYTKKGQYTKKMPTGHFLPGKYRLALFVDDFVMTEEFLVAPKN